MNDWLGRLLESRRVREVLPFVRGRLLDLGCGRNTLVRTYRDGIGVDVHDWGDVDCLVPDSSHLPFPDGAFMTVAILAAFNHIPDREAVLRECRRLLVPDGRLLITMLTPRISRVWHALRAPWDADQRDRGLKEGEVFGFSKRELCDVVQRQGFLLAGHRRFMLGLNSLYIFQNARGS